MLKRLLTLAVLAVGTIYSVLPAAPPAQHNPLIRKTDEQIEKEVERVFEKLSQQIKDSHPPTPIVQLAFADKKPIEWSEPAKDHPKFKRGATRTPAHIILKAPKFKAPPTEAVPIQAAIVPAKLDMWGNDQYGDCVSAEEAFAKACYQPEIFIDANTVIGWARQNGYLNGADLSEVMDSMKSSGFKVGSQLYNDGGYSSVDYSNEANLQAAISQGPVKIAIDANALPNGAGNQQGWYATGKGNFPNTDHCVALSGYGTATYLYQQLGVPLPSGLPGTTNGYLLFTWSTIGFVDHNWLMGTCVEAWVRNPTTVGVPPLTPPTPPTPPGPGPGPTPSSGPVVSSVLTFQDGSTQTLYAGIQLTKDTTIADLMTYIQGKARVSESKSPSNSGDARWDEQNKINAVILKSLQEIQQKLDKGGK
jgi:hypothetical protein